MKTTKQKKPNIKDYPSTDDRTYFELDGTINWEKYANDLDKYIASLESKEIITDEDIERQLLNRFGFIEDEENAIDAKNQLKIFSFMDWYKSHYRSKEIITDEEKMTEDEKYKIQQEIRKVLQKVALHGYDLVSAEDDLIKLLK